VGDLDDGDEQKEKALNDMKAAIEEIHPDNLHTLNALTVLLYQGLLCATWLSLCVAT
jgi:hypothetical protein